VSNIEQNRFDDGLKMTPDKRGNLNPRQWGNLNARIPAHCPNPSADRAASMSQVRLGSERDEHGARQAGSRRAHLRMFDVRALRSCVRQDQVGRLDLAVLMGSAITGPRQLNGALYGRRRCQRHVYCSVDGRSTRAVRSLFQETVARDIVARFGKEFTYVNANGSLGIRKNVLAAFKKLTGDTVVWERRTRVWRKRA
jgi:hypothetical protein